MSYSVCAIICAGGRGARTGFARNKLLEKYGEKTVLELAVAAFDFPTVTEIILPVAAEDFDEISALLSPIPRLKVVLGGEDRTHSVYNALQAATADIVLVHDGARPFVTRKLVEGCLQSVLAYGSGVCAIECRDTVAAVERDRIVAVPPRAGLRQIQTPQGFFRENLLSAYNAALTSGGKTYTDDSSVFAEYCGQPHICEGDPANRKLTYAEDFARQALVGFGVDTHAFGKAQDYILLAGVKIPSESGLVAHSDGDVLLHAVMDAILSAVGLKDIGHYFPDSDEKWRGASSIDMLSTVVSLAKAQGFTVGNLSVAIQAERPRLAKYIDEMKNNLATALSLDPARIGITAGTNEGLGYIGEGKGITVHAFVMMKEV